MGWMVKVGILAAEQPEGPGRGPGQVTSLPCSRGSQLPPKKIQVQSHCILAVSRLCTGCSNRLKHASLSCPSGYLSHLLKPLVESHLLYKTSYDPL